jgi:hypothetical protein
MIKARAEVQRIDQRYTGAPDMEKQLNQREASLVDAFRSPPNRATELSVPAEKLAPA